MMHDPPHNTTAVFFCQKNPSFGQGPSKTLCNFSLLPHFSMDAMTLFYSSQNVNFQNETFVSRALSTPNFCTKICLQTPPKFLKVMAPNVGVWGV